MFSTILVPLDGSPEAAMAVPLACELLAGSEPRLVLVRVEEDPAAVTEAERYLRTTATEHASSVAGIDTQVLRGSPAEQIVRAIACYGADAIVMATHARGEVGRLVLGSVADEVVAASSVPVGVVHPGTTRISPIKSILVPIDDATASRI